MTAYAQEGTHTLATRPAKRARVSGDENQDDQQNELNSDSDPEVYQPLSGFRRRHSSTDSCSASVPSTSVPTARRRKESVLAKVSSASDQSNDDVEPSQQSKLSQSSLSRSLSKQ